MAEGSSGVTRRRKKNPLEEGELISKLESSITLSHGKVQGTKVPSGPMSWRQISSMQVERSRDDRSRGVVGKSDELADEEPDGEEHLER